MRSKNQRWRQRWLLYSWAHHFTFISGVILKQHCLLSMVCTSAFFLVIYRPCSTAKFSKFLSHAVSSKFSASKTEHVLVYRFIFFKFHFFLSNSSLLLVFHSSKNHFINFFFLSNINNSAQRNSYRLASYSKKAFSCSYLVYFWKIFLATF